MLGSYEYSATVIKNIIKNNVKYNEIEPLGYWDLFLSESIWVAKILARGSQLLCDRGYDTNLHCSRFFLFRSKIIC
jgi:hypothetical protein